MAKHVKKCEHCDTEYSRDKPHYHTKKYYMQEYKINPERLNLSDDIILVKDNPYYRSAPPMVLYPLCAVESGKKKHPELLIKPRSEKQKAVAERLAQTGKINAEIKQIEANLNDEMRHYGWHAENGEHRHDMDKWHKELIKREIETEQQVEEIKNQRSKVFHPEVT